MIAMACCWPSDAPSAVQFTALAADGRKAHVEPQRWTRGKLSGAAVQIRPWQSGKRLVITEGIEDALAVQHSLPDVAVWAALGTGNVENTVLPDGAPIVLALDGDEAGRKAAHCAAQKFCQRGHQVSIAQLPDGSDPAALFEGRSA